MEVRQARTRDEAVEVRQARTRDEVGAALALRERVFCGEQGVELQPHAEALDDEALQIVAVDAGEVIGTCRVLLDGPTGRLGRLAVRPAARRRGLGRAILAAAERSAREAGATVMRLHAQRYAENLYAAAGYVPYGEPFDAEGIAHVSMEKRLA